MRHHSRPRGFRHWCRCLGVNLLVAAAEAELPETVERSQQLERKSSFRRTPPEGVRSRATTPPPMSGLPPASVGATPASGVASVSLTLTRSLNSSMNSQPKDVKTDTALACRTLSWLARATAW